MTLLGLFLLGAVVIGVIAWLQAAGNQAVPRRRVQAAVTGQLPADEPEYRLVWAEFGGGSGFVVHRIEDAQRLQWQRLDGEVPGVYVFGVAGESHYIRSIQGPEFAPGAPVRLVPEPDNPYDANAVAVRSADGRLKGGHVPRAEAPEFKRLVESGVPLSELVMWAETIPGKGRCSLRILVAEDDAPIDLSSGDPSARPGRDFTAN